MLQLELRQTLENHIPANIGKHSYKCCKLTCHLSARLRRPMLLELNDDMFIDIVYDKTIPLTMQRCPDYLSLIIIVVPF